MRAFAGGYPGKFFTATSITSETSVWAPDAARKFRLTGMSIAVSAAASVTFKDGTGLVTIYQTPLLAANTPYTIDLGDGILSTALNRPLTATASAAGSLSGTLFGREE